MSHTSRTPAPLRRHARLIALVAVSGLLAAACGSDEPPDTAASASPSASASATPAADGPERIVSLSPTATEMLFAIGAGDQVIAVDEQSDYPPDAPVTELSGFTPNIEAIASYEPDLVVAQYDPGELEAGLGALDIEVLFLPSANSIDEALQQMIDLGEAVGSASAATGLVEEIRTEIDATVAAAPSVEATYYHELDPTFYTVTSATFIGDVYGLFGLTSIGENPDNAYPQLSQEAIIEADPDLIFLADAECCDESVATLSARDGWDTISAVANGFVIEVDEDVTSRWGPRVVDFVHLVADQLDAYVAS